MRLTNEQILAAVHENAPDAMEMNPAVTFLDQDLAFGDWLEELVNSTSSCIFDLIKMRENHNLYTPDVSRQKTHETIVWVTDLLTLQIHERLDELHRQTFAHSTTDNHPS